MGTEIDYFGQEAHITNESELVKSGKITSEAWKNRLLLRQVMREGRFHTLSSEWWHFNFCSRETARKKYALIK
jgi:D-alanyl-D-alanine dipeptidase